MPGNLSSIALAEEEALATEGYTAQNRRKTCSTHTFCAASPPPEQRYIGSTADLKASLAIRRFFLLAKTSGVQRSWHRIPAQAMDRIVPGKKP